MKYNSLDIENKILIACLGIGVITVIFFWAHKRGKNVEGMDSVFESEPMPEGPLDMTGTVGVTVGVNALLSEVAIETDAAINTGMLMTQAEVDTTELTVQAETDTAVMMEQEAVDTAEMIANQIKEGEEDRQAGYVESADSKVLDRLEKVSTIAGTAADIASQSADLAAANAQNQTYNMAQTAANATTTGMYTHFWKAGFLAFLAASGIGSWAIHNIEVLIYRITNFKSCFFWYFLEIIGWLLYLPIEFIVWLFCLQDFEKIAWKGLDAIDCFIYSFIGFYLFKHSDAVNQKCYSKVFTPFPSLDIPFNFDTVGQYMNNMYDQNNAVPDVYGGADQVQATVDQSVQAAQAASGVAITSDVVMASTIAAQIGYEEGIASVP
jgi:hypothetical protein